MGMYETGSPGFPPELARALGGVAAPAEAPVDDEDPWDLVRQAVMAAVEADGNVTRSEMVTILARPGHGSPR